MQNSEDTVARMKNNKQNIAILIIGILLILMAILSFITGSNGFSILQMAALLLMPEFLVNHLFIIAALFGNLYAISMLTTGIGIVHSFVKRKQLAQWFTIILPLINLGLYLLNILTMLLALNHVSTTSAQTSTSASKGLLHVLPYMVNPQSIGTCLLLICIVFLLPKLNQKHI